MAIPGLRSKHLLVALFTMLLITGFALSFLATRAQSAQAYGIGFYQQTNLVSDLPRVARFQDPHLVNPWGIAYGPSTPFRVADNGKGVSTSYNGQGRSFEPVVSIPSPRGSKGPATPTGVVFNDMNSFVVRENGKSAPATFIFATEDGTISGWNQKVDEKSAILEVDNSRSGAVYKGLARGRFGSSDLLYAANFRAGVVDVFDTNFKRVKSFTDKSVPAGYAPFGIQALNGMIFVTFALQDKMKHDDVAGPGHGFVDIFTPGGVLARRLISRGVLNSPWGLAVAPANFGQFSDALLVGNFGDGHVNAFNRTTGAFLGVLKNKSNQPIVINGLWGLIFGNGSSLTGSKNTLFFTAGINHEKDGLFGSIVAENR
jgi:uncharacterized protein (TIGR03118 family)